MSDLDTHCTLEAMEGLVSPAERSYLWKLNLSNLHYMMCQLLVTGIEVDVEVSGARPWQKHPRYLRRVKTR